eukprot:10913129-Ditylum_brightwellii.AAC.1
MGKNSTLVALQPRDEECTMTTVSPTSTTVCPNSPSVSAATNTLHNNAVHNKSSNAATGDNGSIDVSNISLKRKITNISKEGATSNFSDT